MKRRRQNKSKQRNLSQPQNQSQTKSQQTNEVESKPSEQSGQAKQVKSKPLVEELLEQVEKKSQQTEPQETKPQETKTQEIEPQKTEPRVDKEYTSIKDTSQQDASADGVPVDETSRSEAAPLENASIGETTQQKDVPVEETSVEETPKQEEIPVKNTSTGETVQQEKLPEGVVSKQIKSKVLQPVKSSVGKVLQQVKPHVKEVSQQENQPVEVISQREKSDIEEQPVYRKESKSQDKSQSAPVQSELAIQEFSEPDKKETETVNSQKQKQKKPSKSQIRRQQFQKIKERQEQQLLQANDKQPISEEPKNLKEFHKQPQPCEQEQEDVRKVPDISQEENMASQVPKDNLIESIDSSESELYESNLGKSESNGSEQIQELNQSQDSNHVVDDYWIDKEDQPDEEDYESDEDYSDKEDNKPKSNLVKLVDLNYISIQEIFKNKLTFIAIIGAILMFATFMSGMLYKEKISLDEMYLTNGMTADSYSIDEQGQERKVVMYGPYISLKKGSYKIKVNYTSDENNTIKVNAFKGGATLATEDLLAGEKETVTVDFDVPFDMLDSGIEFLMYYNGDGLLQINSITVSDNRIYLKESLIFIMYLAISILFIIFSKIRKNREWYLIFYTAMSLLLGTVMIENVIFAILLNAVVCYLIFFDRKSILESKKAPIYSALTLFAFAIMILATKCSPFYIQNDWVDTQSYYTMGKGIFNGKALYKDLFEQKGPLFYLLYGIGYLINTSNLHGVYFLEGVAASLAFIYIYKIAKIYLNDKAAIISVFLIPILIYNKNFMKFGGTCEEFMIPLLLMSIYYFIKMFECNCENKRYMLINGILGGLVLMMKFNISIYFGGLGLCVYLKNIYDKNYDQFIQNILYTFVGAAIIVIPTMFWLLISGSIPGFLEVISANSKYTSIKFNVDGFDTLIKNITSYFNTNWFCSLIMSIGILAYLAINKQVGRWLKAGIIISFISLLYGVYAGLAQPYYYLTFAVFVSLAVISIIAIIADLLEKYIHVSSEQIIQTDMQEETEIFVDDDEDEDEYKDDDKDKDVYGAVNNIDKQSNISLSHFGFSRGVVIVFAIISILLTAHYNNNFTQSKPYIDYASVQDRFAMKIKSESEADGIYEPTLLNYGFLDGGFYTAADILPNIRFFQRQNISKSVLPENYSVQLEAVANKKVDFVVTRRMSSDSGAEITEITDNYDLIAEQDQSLEGINFTYSLYKVKPDVEDDVDIETDVDTEADVNIDTNVNADTE